MRVQIGNLSVSLSEKVILTKKKDEWIKEVMQPFENSANSATIKAALSDAYDKAKGAKPKKEDSE